MDSDLIKDYQDQIKKAKEDIIKNDEDYKTADAYSEYSYEQYGDFGRDMKDACRERDKELREIIKNCEAEIKKLQNK